VATLKLHTNLLFPIDFNSGSPPKLPTIKRVIKEIKNNKKEKYMEDEKIQVSVPRGYELKQNGLNIEFVKKPDSLFLISNLH
jgi:hypothetical protein